MPLRAIITEATTADCRQAIPLIEGMKAEQLLADKAYDTNEILQLCEKHNTIPVIPSKSNRQCPRQHDAYLYRQRHLVENAFLWLKRWCGIATVCEKRLLMPCCYSFSMPDYVGKNLMTTLSRSNIRSRQIYLWFATIAYRRM